MGYFRADAAALRACRQAKGYKQARTAARHIGCTTNLLTKLETATGAPIEDELLRRIALVYECSPEALAHPLPIQDRQLCPHSIQRRRKERGLSLQDLAMLSETGFSSLWRWEQTPALIQFDYNRIRRVAQALDCTVEELTRPVSVPHGLAG